MRALGYRLFSDLDNLGPAYREIPTCACCAGPGSGKLSTGHMPKMDPDQTLIRILIGRSGTVNTFEVESTDDIALGNKEYDNLPAGGSQHWFIASRTAVAADFPAAA